MPGWDGYWDHHGYGWIGTLFMILTMVVFWGGLITVTVLLVRHWGHNGTGQDGARRILDERLARGEIDRDEYEQRSQALRAGRR